MADRSKELRAGMKARGATSNSAAMSMGKDKVKQLKLARQQQMQMQLQQQQQQQISQAHPIVSKAVPNPAASAEAIVPLEPKKTKAVSISNLLKDSSLGVAASGVPQSVAARPAQGNSTEVSPIPATHAQGSSSREAYYEYVPSVSPAGADPVVADPPIATGGLGLPKGFFDDPRADIEARGLSVKAEVQRKEKEQESVLQSFLGEVGAMDGGQSDDSEADSGGEGNIEDSEIALQLAYETRTATFMAKVEKNIDKLKDSSGKTNSHNGTIVDVEREVDDVDTMIAEASGLKRAANESILDDVMEAMQRKRQRLAELRSEAGSADIKEISDRPRTSGGASCSSGDEGTRDSEDSDDEDYAPLDYANWQSRAL